MLRVLIGVDKSIFINVKVWELSCASLFCVKFVAFPWVLKGTWTLIFDYRSRVGRNMRITRNLRAISKLSLTLLLLVVFIVGAVISYMFAMGYIVSLGLQLPKNPAITIANVTFPPQDATTFNVTILNPSYSPSTATITQIIAITDGVSQTTTIVRPLSREIKPGSLENFTCSWDWSSYTGKTVTVHAFVEGGSGATFEAKTPFMDLSITDVYLNSTVSTAQFNVTIQNSELSATYVNVTSITVTLENETVQEIFEVAPNLPYGLDRGSSEIFVCKWNWTDYRSKDVRITARTLQGYKASREAVTPERVILNITEAIFNVTDSNYFNVTVQSSDLSSTDVDILGINVATVTLQNVIPSLPYNLRPGSLVQFRCRWDWKDYQGENITIAVDTLQGYTANYIQAVPLLAELRITEVLFNEADTHHFNITVENHEFSRTYVNITKITITLEDGFTREINETEPMLTPPYLLPQSTSVTFNCTWDWTDYRGKKVVVAVYTAQGYIVFSSEVVTPLPVKLSITVNFDLANTTHFTVTVENSKFSIDYVVVTKMEVTLWNGTLLKSIDVIPTLLFPNEWVPLVGSWNWTYFPTEGVTITVYTLQGYTIDSIGVTTPRWVNLTIEEALFNATDTFHFNVTVRNPGPSPYPVNITSITVTLENETIQITNEVIPGLPFKLNFNTSETLQCPWNWTYHRSKAVMITVHTREGYVAYFSVVTPPPVNITITEVLFNVSNMTQFNVTVQNSEFSPTYANITSITITLENGTMSEITEVSATFPYILDRNDSVTFVCSWDWTLYRGKSLTVTVYQWQGYPANYTQVTPPPVIITVTEALFNDTDTTHFQVTVNNTRFSLTYDVITRITVILENGTTLEIIEVIPTLPYILDWNDSATFMCSWNWTDYRNKSVTIIVYTLRGYTADYTLVTPP